MPLLEEGTKVGYCSSCDGVITDDDMTDAFPNLPECKKCGGQVDEVKILGGDEEVPDKHMVA